MSLELWLVPSAALSLYFVCRTFLAKSSLSNIPGPPRTSWWNGIVAKFYDPNGWKFHHEILQKYGTVVKLPMALGHDELYVADPLALHHILIKDQYTYEMTRSLTEMGKILIGRGLVQTFGEEHRKQRKMLNPVFSMKHMRDLLPIFYRIAYDLREVLTEQVQDDATEMNVVHWVSRAALDFIAQAGFGYPFNALHDDKTAGYGEYFKKILPLSTGIANRFQYLLPWILSIGTPSFRRKVVESIPSKYVKESLYAVDVLDTKSKAIYQEKKMAYENGDEEKGGSVGKGKDILSAILKTNAEASEHDRLPEEEIIAQINTFVIAGQDTSSRAIARILHQLSLNPDVQAKLREETITARKERSGIDFDYDSLMGLPYLDAVIRETMRVFPPVVTASRTTTKDVVMPLAWPILGADGKTEITEVPIKKNTTVIVSIPGVNKSKKIWGEDAEEWKPDRWLQPLPDSVAKAHVPGVYSSLMTFIGGGRACIGFKFAEMEIKTVLTVLLEMLEFQPGPEVEWRMAGIMVPVLKNSTDSAENLPLKVVSLVKNQ